MIASEVSGIVEASCLGAVGIEGMVDSLPPLPVSPHFGPIAAEFLEEENINFVCLNGLEQSGLERALGL